MLENLLDKYKSKIPKKYRKLYLLNLFSWNLVIYSIPLALLSYRLLNLPHFVLKFFSTLIYEILRILGIEAYLAENTILVKSQLFMIDQDCVGYKSILGTFAIVFATPYVESKVKVRYFLTILPVLFLINILRVVSTISLFYYLDIPVKFVHDVLWSVLTSFVVLLCWFYFFNKHKEDIKKKLLE